LSWLVALWTPRSLPPAARRLVSPDTPLPQGLVAAW
jgi:hypothetical protein